MEVVGIRYGTLSFRRGARGGHPSGELLLGPIWGRLACREGLCGVGRAVSPLMVCGRCRGALERIGGSPCPLTATRDRPALLNGTVPSAFTSGAAAWSPRALPRLSLGRSWRSTWAQSWAIGCTSWTSEGGSPALRTPELSSRRYTAPRAGRERGWSWLPAPCQASRLSIEVEHLFPTQIAAVINSALDTYFPEGCGVEIVARPGRYYVTSAFTLAASITAKEEIPAEQPGSDGPWGCGAVGSTCLWDHGP